MKTIPLSLVCFGLFAPCSAQVMAVFAPPDRELLVDHAFRRGTRAHDNNSSRSPALRRTWSDVRILYAELACQPHADTFSMNWSLCKPTNSPSARAFHAMTYDSARQRTVLFGGNRGGDETWEWDGKTWAQMKPTTSPSARAEHAMAYDSARRRTVLFGGTRKGGAETWEWDGKTWTQGASAKGWSQLDHAMVYDPVRKVTVLFGGLRGRQGDTWEWDGSGWKQRFTQTSPPLRYAPAMVYDSTQKHAVMFGGGGIHYLADTWKLCDISLVGQFTPFGAGCGLVLAAEKNCRRSLARPLRS